MSYIPSPPPAIQWVKNPILGTELAGAEASLSLPTGGRGAHRWEEEVPQQRAQPLSLPDALLGHPPRLPQNHPNPGASPGPGASCSRNETRELQGTSAGANPPQRFSSPVHRAAERPRTHPAAELLLQLLLRASAAAWEHLRTGAEEKAAERRARPKPGTAPPASRQTRPHHVLIGQCGHRLPT